MSYPFRAPIGSQPTVPGRMIPPVCATGPPPVIPAVPNAYGLVPGQTHYVPHPSFPQNLPNVPHRMPVISATPGSIPAMYIPVGQINPSLSSPSIDPAKLLEEQRKLEKERNFQLQQQRLKQFTIAGKKGNINAENLIDSMFGKVQPKPNRASSISSVNPSGSNASESVKSSKPVSENIPIHTLPVNLISENIHTLPANIIRKEIPPDAFKTEKKDKKELDAMMLECSDLSGPQKASKFSKPSVKELAPTLQQKHTFMASEKARDWRNLRGLDEVFLAKPRFPEWCNKEHVPELYKQIEAIVTNNGSHSPDTKLLFPILVSSGLPHPILGQIWELVNHSAPGHLTVEEMYAALAIIAVTQAGHPVSSVDILHQFPACPVPQLQYFTTPSGVSTVETKSTESSNSKSTEGEKIFPSAAEPALQYPSSHQVLRPSAISLKDTNTLNFYSTIPAESKTESRNIATAGSGFISSPDDDFDDFKSATPTAVNFSIQTPSSDTVPPEDEFADFQQALPLTTTTTACKDSLSFVTAKPPPVVEPDLMSPDEDKYSVFRTLQQHEEPNDWGDFSDATSDLAGNDLFNIPKVTEYDASDKSSDFQSNQMDSGVIGGLFAGNNSGEVNTIKDNNEFGEFLQAKIPPPIAISSVTTQLENLSANFADFANFKEPEINQVPSTRHIDNSQLDDEFGDFASSLPVPTKPDVGHDFLFHHVKDNISLAESQSVSSLELGTFDGGGHSGESKSSLSRQGSIPSLDLKSTYLEGPENDEFGEFQAPAFVNRGSKSPSPAKDIKTSEYNNISSTTSLGLPFQNSRNVPLTDKYSMIRAEERKEEDQHISSWVRCLQSSVDILQNTKKIFNQMSCSSVCNEVLQTEEGENYIKDVIEVYRVVRRIATASKFVGKQTVPMLDLLKEADQAWNTICGFFAGSPLMPPDSSLEFSNAVLNAESEDNTKACGLCLLNVEAKIKSNNRIENLILSYGGRNYHSPCANLWVNCVDPLLPALTLPQLL